MHYASLFGESHEMMKHAGFKGIADKNEHNWEDLMKTVNGHVKKLNWTYETQLTEKEVKFYRSLAKLLDKHTIEVKK
jgi:pyruvate/2-oxoglutarate dehydrogenase complex dihydrolipoamide dehydrogenase (E3) component